MAVAAIAKNLGTDFSQFYDIFVPAAKQIVMSCTSKDERRLRGKAFESIALIGQAVGIDKFAADATETLNVLVTIQKQGMDSDDPQTRCILQACSRICSVLGVQSLPYLPILIPPLLTTVTQHVDFSFVDVDPEAKKEDDKNTVRACVCARHHCHHLPTFLSPPPPLIYRPAEICHFHHHYSQSPSRPCFTMIRHHII